MKQQKNNSKPDSGRRRVSIALILIGVLTAAVLFIMFFRAFVPGWTLASGDGSLGQIERHYKMLPHYYLHQWSTTASFGTLGPVMPCAPSYLLAHLVDYTKYADANYIFGLLVLGIFGYFLALGITRNRFAASAAGLWFMLQPHVLSHALPGHIGHFAMAAWSLGPLLFLRKAIQTDRKAIDRIMSWIMAGGCLGVMIQSGTHDVVLFFGMLYAAYAIFLLARRFLFNRAAVDAERKPAAFARCALGGLLAAVLCVSLGLKTLNSFVSIIFKQDVQTARVDKSSPDEAHEEWLWATQWSVPPEEVLDFALPGFFGWESADQVNPYRGRVGQTDGFPAHRRGFPNFNQISNYVGAVMLLGCIVAIVLKRRDPEMWFFLVVAALSCLLAFGKYGPVYNLFYKLPYMSAIRNPIKWFYITSCSLGILGAMGLAAADEKARTTSGRSTRALLTVLLPVLVVITAGILFLSKAERTYGLFWADSRLRGLSTFSLVVGAVFWAAAALGFWLMLRPAGPKKKDPQASPAPGVRAITWSRGIIWIVLLAELWHVNSHYLPYQRVSDVIQGGPLVDVINAEDRPFRIQMGGSGPIHSYVSNKLVPFHMWELLMSSTTRRGGDDTLLFLQSVQGNPEKMLRLCNVRFLLSKGEIKSPLLKPVLSMSDGSGPVILYRFLNELPRYYLVPTWRIVSDPANKFGGLSDPSFDPGKEAFVASANGIPVPQVPAQPATDMKCRTASYSWYKIELETSADADCMLIGLDRYNDAWRVTIDGKEAPMLTANGILRAIPVQAGSHSVVLSLKKSWSDAILEGVALVVFLFLWIYLGYRRFRRSKEPAT